MNGWKAAIAAATRAALASAVIGAGVGASTPSRPAAPGRSPATTTGRPGPLDRDQKEEVRLSGEYARMADELGMQEPQRRRLAQTIEAKEKALQVWDQRNGKRLDTLRQAISKAKSEGKEGLARQLEPQVKAMEQARARVENAGEARIMAVLTPEQRAAWEGKKLAKEVLERFRSVRLEADQVAKVEALSQEAAKQFKGVVTDEDLRAAADQLVPIVVERILTDAQRAQLQKSTTKPPARPGGARPPPAAPPIRAPTPTPVPMPPAIGVSA
jgi:hypothetical protein